MSALPKISIVTPSFNQAEFLEECIDSILGQGYPNLEYVIMDGGSADNSVEIIKKYEKHLTFWQSKPDGGQYAAINAGFAKTSGEIMAWLNSDDKYHAHAFHTVACLFQTPEKPEWITGRQSFWNRQGDPDGISSEVHTFSRADFLAKKYSSPFIQQESTFWRRSLWERSGGCLQEQLGYAADLELWLRFFRHAELHSADVLIGGYRRHGNQKAVLGLDRYLAEAEQVVDKEIELVALEGPGRMNPPPPVLSLSHHDLASFCAAADFPMAFRDRSALTVAAYLLARLTTLTAELQNKQEQHAACEADRAARGACIEEQSRTLTEMQQVINAYEEGIAGLRQTINSIEGSLSWRLTAPIRAVADKLGHITRK